jgi:hypothetical protein
VSNEKRKKRKGKAASKARRKSAAKHLRAARSGNPTLSGRESKIRVQTVRPPKQKVSPSVSEQGREAKPVCDSRSGNQVVQGAPSQGRVQEVLRPRRQEIPRDGELEAQTSAAPSTALVPASRQLPQNALVPAPASREVPRFYEGLNEAIAIRDSQIIAENRNEKIQTNLPPDVADFLDKWLRRNHLMLCATDPEFWRAFEHVLTSLEGFSLECVEEALKVCLVGAWTASRRTATKPET